MAERSRRQRRRGAGLVLAALGAFAFVAMMPVGAEAASQSGNISVDIVDGSTPSPVPTQSGSSQNPGTSGSSGGATAPGRSSTGGSGAGSGSGAVSPANLGNDSAVPASEVPPGAEVLFFVSGLTATGHPSANPVVGGRVTAELNVQNLTSERIDATVDFHADDLFGNEVAKAPTSTLIGLQPDEMRTVSVDLGEVRIAGLVRVYATVTPLTPPGMAELEPVNRDAWTALPSWYAVGLLAATAISLGVGAFFRFRRGL